MGACHGSAGGKGGFRLTLRGYDPELDYFALVDDLSGRRLNRSLPSQSLMLLKPTQGVPHVGGFLFDEDSRYYKLIHGWIAEGCQYDNQTRVARLEVFPVSPVIDREGRQSGDSLSSGCLFCLRHAAVTAIVELVGECHARGLGVPPLTVEIDNTVLGGGDGKTLATRFP